MEESLELILEVATFITETCSLQLLQAAEGMTFLHSLKKPVLHRDLRCANIMVSTADKVKVSGNYTFCMSIKDNELIKFTFIAHEI